MPAAAPGAIATLEPGEQYRDLKRATERHKANGNKYVAEQEKKSLEQRRVRATRKSGTVRRSAVTSQHGRRVDGLTLVHPLFAGTAMKLIPDTAWFSAFTRAWS
ncbi:MAG: hypothetical protein M3Y67_08325, partial [Pseudomonadota bacterium]|nr:hypothetical protein [Pseudomonadota bacterium]